MKAAPFKITPVRLQQLKQLLHKQHQDTQEAITDAKLTEDYQRISTVIDALAGHTEAVNEFLQNTIGFSFNEAISDLLQDIANANAQICDYVSMVRSEYEQKENICV